MMAFSIREFCVEVGVGICPNKFTKKECNPCTPTDTPNTDRRYATAPNSVKPAFLSGSKNCVKASRRGAWMTNINIDNAPTFEKKE